MWTARAAAVAPERARRPLKFSNCRINGHSAHGGGFVSVHSTARALLNSTLRCSINTRAPIHASTLCCRVDRFASVSDPHTLLNCTLTHKRLNNCILKPSGCRRAQLPLATTGPWDATWANLCLPEPKQPDKHTFRTGSFLILCRDCSHMLGDNLVLTVRETAARVGPSCGTYPRAVAVAAICHLRQTLLGSDWDPRTRSCGIHRP